MSKVKKNIVYQAVYQILHLCVPLITTPIVSRALGPSVLGDFSYTSAIVSYFALFCLLGVNNYGLREIAKVNKTSSRKELSSTFWSIYTMQLSLSAIVISLYFVYWIFFNKADSKLAIIQGIMLLSAATDISWFYFGLEEFRITVTRNVCIKLLSALIIIAFIRQKSDVYLYAFAVSAGPLISNVVLLTLSRKRVFYIKPSMTDVVRHLKPNLLLFVPVVAASFFVYIDKIMIGNMAADYDVGFYEGMEKIINVPNAMISAVSLVMYPRITSILKEKGLSESIRDYIEKSVISVIFFSTGCTFGLIALSDFFVPLFLGKQFEPVIPILRVGVFILLPRGIRQVIKSEILLPKEKDRQVTISIVIGAAIDFIINLILIPRYKAYGATLATVLCEIASCLLMVWYSREKWVYKLFLHLIPFTAFGSIMLVLINHVKERMSCSWLSIVMLVLTGGAIYAFLSLQYYLVIKRKKA